MSLFGPNADFRQVSDSYVQDIDRLVAAAGQFDGEGVADWLSELEPHITPTAAVLGAMLALAPGKDDPKDNLSDDDLKEFAELLADNWAGGSDDVCHDFDDAFSVDPSKPYDWESEPDELAELAAASVPPFEVWPELLLAILRDSTGPANGWSPDSLVSARKWSLHAAVVIGFLAADWLVTDRWRLLCEAVASVSVEGDALSFRRSWGSSDD